MKENYRCLLHENMNLGFRFHWILNPGENKHIIGKCKKETKLFFRKGNLRSDNNKAETNILKSHY